MQTHVFCATCRFCVRINFLKTENHYYFWSDDFFFLSFLIDSIICPKQREERISSERIFTRVLTSFSCLSFLLFLAKYIFHYVLVLLSQLEKKDESHRHKIKVYLLVITHLEK